MKVEHGMIVTLPDGYRCDIGNDHGSLSQIHKTFYLNYYGDLSICGSDSVFDSGAHIGLFTLKLARQCFA